MNTNTYALETIAETIPDYAIRKLRRLALTNLTWEGQHKVTDEISTLIPQCTPAEVASVAVQARLINGFKYLPLYITVEMFKHHGYNAYAGNAMRVLIDHPGMMIKWLEIYWKEGKKSLPAQAKKALRLQFNSFHEAQFMECRGKKIKLRDVMFMVRPKPTSSREEALFEKIANNKL